MNDRADTEAVIYRVAVMAFAFQPDRQPVHSDRVLEEDVDWCLEPVLQLEQPLPDGVRQAIRDAIIDPTAHRQHLAHVVSTLAAT